MIDSYAYLRPLLFKLDPEQSHNLALSNLDRAERWGLLKLLIEQPVSDPKIVCGIAFPNPVGLAAGLDKDGKHIDALAALGFGFLEIGTVTPLPQAGNPKPRMFRLSQAQGIINRMGFNNDGVETCVERVKQSNFWQNGGVLGLNIGKNAATPIESAASDYIKAMESVYEISSYITVNISSPNTQNLRALQGEDLLRSLLRDLSEARQRLNDSYSVRKPLFLKIAPDLHHQDVNLIADLLQEFGIDAVIATNTTIARESVSKLKHGHEAGGLSGAPLKAASTDVIKTLHARLQGAIPIIGVGGILSGADAQEKVAAGASLIQLYSGLIFKGPALVYECATALKQ
ncbi:dihydroorotate oxidase A [Polynucleobacter meluiroseus]|uniref:Dihydroorotate dehydrogenase (quinone) n=1 Tax=Polynucleobacter meluiroseus TaxID=1938814 RepID=A0A240DZX3_9BURK|nr:quinone-dependent dihydroorotate dehydrogenase [Polynucleobacter meluiroseus]SNX28502.1 dihydroorotate oxidase A [Polynucleobacter meluiroseus]